MKYKLYNNCLTTQYKNCLYTSRFKFKLKKQIHLTTLNKTKTKQITFFIVRVCYFSIKYIRTYSILEIIQNFRKKIHTKQMLLLFFYNKMINSEMYIMQQVLLKIHSSLQKKAFFKTSFLQRAIFRSIKGSFRNMIFFVMIMYLKELYNMEHHVRFNNILIYFLCYFY